MLDGTHESIKASLWGSLVLLGATFYYLLQRDPQWQMLLIGAMTFPIIYGLQAPPSYFIGQKRFGLSAAYWIASELVVAIVVVGVVFIHPSPTLLVLASVSASCLVNSAFFLKAYSEVRHTPSQHDSGLLSYGRHLTGITAIGTIANYLDRVLISLYLDFTALAVFNVAAIFPDIVKSMAKYIDPLVLPRFAGLTKQQVSQRVRGKLLPMLMINWLTVIIAVFLTPLMIHLAYPAYLESVRYARWLFISLAFIVPTLVINSALTSQQSTRQLYQANLIFATVQIGSLIILVPTMGLLGAVLSRVISRFCLAAYYGHALYSLEKSHG
jgi:O-antigen/teichoic acid export membrane protein